MVQRFKETGQPVLQSTSALSRGILKQRKGKCTVHFNGDLMNTELLFRTVHSVNQLSTYGAVANWCYQFALTEEEKRKSRYSCGQQDFDHQKKWNCWYLSPPTQAPRNSMQGSALSFQTLEKKIQLAQLCEKKKNFFTIM